MILPIHLTGRLGLPGGGVPNFSLDAAGNVIGAQFWPTGSDASGNDPATGEPMSASGSGYTNDASVWTGDSSMSSPDSDPNVIHLQPLRDTRGTQWSRHGAYTTESGFDRWRRAGRPTACSLGDITTEQRILQAIASGANAAANPYYIGAPQPQIAIGGSASTGAWILGGIAAVAVIFVLTRRR